MLIILTHINRLFKAIELNAEQLSNKLANLQTIVSSKYSVKIFNVARVGSTSVRMLQVCAMPSVK